MAFQEAGLQLMEKLSAVHPAHLLTTCHVCLIFVRIYEGPGKCRITNTVSVVPHDASTSKVLQLHACCQTERGGKYSVSHFIQFLQGDIRNERVYAKASRRKPNRM